MNIFYLSSDPVSAAASHCDKHVVKMILEYGQLLSTAHRVLGGAPTTVQTGARTRVVHLLEGEKVTVGTSPGGLPRLEIVNQRLFKATHINHPCAIWARTSAHNYQYLYSLFKCLLSEYTHRYGRIHSAAALIEPLGKLPKGIPYLPFTEPPQAMPDEYKADDAITAYQNLYVYSKVRFARWTNRRPPTWFISRVSNYDPTNFERTR